MHRLRRRAPDRTDGVHHALGLGEALLARRFSFPDTEHLPQKSGSARLDERFIRRQTHPIDMSSGIDVIQSIYDRIEASKPVDLEQGVGDDVAVDRFYFYIRVKSLDGFSSNNSFALPDVFFSEEELAVQVGNIYSVQIYYGQFFTTN